MKVFLFCLIALFGIAIAIPLNEDWDDDVDDNDDDPIAQPEPWFRFHGSRYPTYGIEDYDDGGLQFWGVGPSIFDSYNRLRELMDKIQKMLYSMNNGTGTFFDSLPPDYLNHTFTSEVINGSIITVNSTIKKHAGNNTGYIFVHKVVNIRPQNETVGNAETVAPIRPQNPDAVTGLPEFGTDLPSTENPSAPPNPIINNIP